MLTGKECCSDSGAHANRLTSFSFTYDISEVINSIPLDLDFKIKKEYFSQ